MIMNENINLCEILKGHEGETFYSPIFGNLTLFAINFQILEFTSIENDTVAIESSGKFYNKADEIAVYPSKDQRDWNKWGKEHNPKVPKTWSELSINHKSKLAFCNITERRIGDYHEKLGSCGDSAIEKSALALLKIHQLIEVGYGGNVTDREWRNTDIQKWYFIPNSIYSPDEGNNMWEVVYTQMYLNKRIFAFHTKEQAEEFLSYPENIQLLKDYFMI